MQLLKNLFKRKKKEHTHPLVAMEGSVRITYNKTETLGSRVYAYDFRNFVELMDVLAKHPLPDSIIMFCDKVNETFTKQLAEKLKQEYAKED